MGVPGCPEFARWTASMDSVRMVLTHSSSKARWSVCTVKAAPLLRDREPRKLPEGRCSRTCGLSLAPRAPRWRTRGVCGPPAGRCLVGRDDLTPMHLRYIVMHRETTNDLPRRASMTRGHAMHQPWEGPAVDPRVLSHWLRAMGGGHHGQGRGRGGRDRRHGDLGWGPGGPFPPGFPFHRGRGPRARRGDVRAALLALLAEEPRNGYQLMQEIERRSGGMWRPSPGSVYPALQQLEDEGLVHAEVQDGRRHFALTDAGRAHVEAQGDALKEPWRAAS